jgi:hypothetical protein
VTRGDYSTMVRREYVPTKEHKENVRLALKEYYFSLASQKTCRKISQAVMSRPPVSKETREKMSKAQILRHKTHPHPKPNQGKRLPSEWCSKISKGLKHYYYSHTVNNKGKQYSQLTKRTISGNEVLLAKSIKDSPSNTLGKLEQDKSHQERIIHI